MKQIAANLIMIFFVINFLSLSCKKEENNNLTDNQIIPLAVGNQWVYSTIGGNDTLVIETSVKKGDYQTFEFSDDDYTFGVHWLYYKNNDIWGFEIGAIDYFTSSILLIPSNLEVNKTISWDSGITMKIISIDETVIVPAGTFNCFKIAIYGWYDNDTPYYYWISKGIGVIKLFSQLI